MKIFTLRLIPFALCSVLAALTGCEPQEPAPRSESTLPPPPAATPTPMPSIKPPEEPKPPPESIATTPPEDHRLYLRYLSTGESFYTEIKLEQGILYRTQFQDTDNRCAQWVKSTPCWTEDDLKTSSIPLSREDIDNLYAVIGESGIFDIQETQLGGAKKGQRYYAQRLEIHMGEVEKHLIYQSFPGATAKPEAFKRMETALLEYARAMPDEK